MDISELQAIYDALVAELRAAEATQLNTPPGTTEWWDAQAQVGALRLQVALANQNLLQAEIATVSPNSAQAVSWTNELFYVQQELSKAQAS